MYVAPTSFPSATQVNPICQNGATTSVSSPAIFVTYFPNTSIGFYWSDIANGIWDPLKGAKIYPSNQTSVVNFVNGDFKITQKNDSNYVRLVHCETDCLIKKITIPVCNKDRGEKYDLSTNSCIMPQKPVCTPYFQDYDYSTNRCITIPRPTCSNNQIYKSTTNECVERTCTTDPSMCYKDPTPPKYPNCDPSTQYLDFSTNKCVTKVTCNQFSPGWNSKTKSCSYK
jgi:hypothetical protein